MAQNFTELSYRAKRSWSDDTAGVCQAGSGECGAEVNERAERGAVLAPARKARPLSEPALCGGEQREVIEPGSPFAQGNS
jgi:hypothetical protein